jgi:hypothetical protein
MLEFIVLGENPGTTIVLSFWQVVELGLLFAALVFFGMERRHQRTLRETLQEIINRRAL